MAKVVNLAELVPEDLVIRHGELELVIPGDIDTETLFGLIEAFQAAADAEGSDDVDRTRQVLETMRAQLLTLLRQRQPDLEALPFGIVGTQRVLTLVLEQFGYAVERATGRGPEPKPKTAPARRRAGSRG